MGRRGIAAILIALAFGTSCGYAQTADGASGDAGSAIPATLASALQAELDAWAAQPRHRGVSAAVILEDGREWVATAGVESTGTPLRPEHLIWMASITKSMTGAVILGLAEDGVLGLDDPVSRWLHPIPNVDPAISVRQLLNHTNGLANYTRSPDLGHALEADPQRRYTADDLIGFVGPPVFPPGERTQYTNTAFVLLGMIAEKAAGRPITDLWVERLWQPLGLREVFLPGVQTPPGPVARAWTGRTSEEEVTPLDQMGLLSLGNSAFGLFGNARTVAGWGRALFSGDVLGTAMRKEMVTLVPAAGNIPGESGAGLGIRGYGYLGRQQWGHSGGSPLGSSLLLYDPKTGITVAVLMNQGANADHFSLAPRLLEIAAAN